MASRRIEILITIFGLLGAAFFLAFYDQAFPSAALELELSRGEIAQLAQETMRAYGFDVMDYEFALSFQENWSASVYLQRTLGIPETNRRLQSEQLPIWYWHARWFRPLQKEEFGLDLAPDGRVVGLSHSIQEDESGESLSEEQALALAEAYLVEQHDWALADWERVSTVSQDMPGGRRDHYFEWKRREFEAGDSELRISVGVKGGRADGYDYWLKVPEAFTRSFSEQSNRASFISDLCFIIGFGGFTMVAVGIFVFSVLRRARPRRSAIMIAVLTGCVVLLSQLNYLPLYKLYYGTTQNYVQFWLGNLFSIALSATTSMAGIFLIWSGGERIGKLVWPGKDRILSLRGDRWVTLTRSSWRGLMLSGLMGGYVVSFYLVATRLLGGWTPMDVEYTNLYATPFPFLAPIRSGLLPAIQEEVLFRLVGIGLILGLTRRRWLALLVPGALWAFAHLGYVRDPYYMRGIELIIPAVFLEGLFFLRFDLTTTIVAHMTYNAMLGALPMLRSGEPYFVFSGLVVVIFLLSPLLPGLYRSLRIRLGAAKPLDEPVIGPATLADLPGLQALPVEGPSWEGVLSDPGESVYCLRAAGQVVGVAVGRLDADVGSLEFVYVAPEWRERYWGSRLVDALRIRLEAMGAASLQAPAPAGNRLALAFLAGQGWTPNVMIFSSGSRPAFPSLRQVLAFIKERFRRHSQLP